MAPFSSLSQLDKLPTPVSKGREGVSPSPGFPVPTPANQDSRQTTLQTNRKPKAYRAQMHTATQEHKYTHRYTCNRPMDTHMPMCAHSVHRGTLTLCSSGDAMQPFGSTHCDLFALEELWPQKGQTRQGGTVSPLPNRGLCRWRQPKEELRMLGPELVHAPALGIYTQQFQREAPEKGSPTYLSCHHLASTQASRSWGQSHPRTCRRVTVLSPRTEALCSPLLLQSTPAPSWRDDGVSYRAPALSCLVPSKSPAAAPSCSRQLTLLLRSSFHH